jgi:CMP-N-acetylneuraminic acid synthetase
VKNMKEKTLPSRFLGVIPARGGSVGLPGKNLMEVQGISLIARTVLIAQKIREIQWIIVSTDDEDIAKEAERAGANIPFKRPIHLARSDTPMVEVLKHAVDWFCSSISDANAACDGVVLLQPTSPMRKREHVTGAIDLYVRSRMAGWDVAGIHTVSPVPEDRSPWNLWRCEENTHHPKRAIGRGFPMVKMGEKRTNDQLYYRNGAAVILDPEHLEALTLARGPVIPYIIDRPLVTIDSIFDLLTIECCGERLEPDPLEIGWRSSRNNCGPGERAFDQ